MKDINQLEKDLKLYTRITAFDSTNAAVWFLKSNTFYNLSRLKEALESVNTGISLAKRQGLRQYLPDMFVLKKEIIHKLKTA